MTEGDKSRAAEMKKLEIVPGQGRPAPRPGPPPNPGRPEEFGLADLGRAALERRWTIAGLLLASLAAAAAYLALATPVYRASALIRVEGRATGGASLGELGIVRQERAPAELEPELVLLRSRQLLGAVVDELGLDRVAVPRRAPLFGHALARRWRGPGPAPAPLGLSRFGWGGEQLRLALLEVPPELLDVPLRLTALEGGRFRLQGPGAFSIEGTVGVPASSSGEQPADVLVEELVARPGTEFTVLRRRRDDVAEALQDELRLAEKAKKSGVLVLTLDGADREQAAAIVNAIAAAYLRTARERDSAEVSRAQLFLDAQLPALKSKVDATEGALDSFLASQRGSSSSVEGPALVSRRAEIDRELSALEQQRAELAQRYTDRHPLMVELAAKLRQLRARQEELAARLRQLPVAQDELARLTRDARLASEQYLQRLAEARQLKAAQAVAGSRAALLDAAVVPLRPVSPLARQVLSLAALLGLLAGVGVAFAAKALGMGGGDAAELERATGLPVFATLPHSRRQDRATRSTRRRPAGPLPVLAALEPADATVENLRALRTTVQAAAGGPGKNVVAVLGPRPGVGKSFVCANLAQALAASGRKVLLIDADLRSGVLHRYFGIPPQPGLSDVLCGAATLEAALVRTKLLDVLPAGSRLAGASELLARPAFEELLAALARQYELVLVDTAPLLAVADPLSVARLAGLNLLVLRAWRRPVRDARLAIKRLERAGAAAQGIVLNDARQGGEAYGAYRGEEPGPPAVAPPPPTVDREPERGERCSSTESR